MSTTLLMPENFNITYTVLGGAPQETCEDALPITIILLPRGPRPLQQIVLETVRKAGFYHAILVVQEEHAGGLERIIAQNPGVKIIVCKDAVLPGTMVNIALYEACTRYGLVMWNDMQFETPGLSIRFFEKLEETNACCIVPHIFDVHGQSVPSLKNPVRQKKHFRIVPLTSEDAGIEKSLYPHDYCGLYNRDQFLACGGFDRTFTHDYYQLADFGMRVWLWGHTIEFNKTIRMKYTLDMEPENTSITHDYYRYWARNVAPHYVLDHAELQNRYIIPLLVRSRLGLGNAIRLFMDAKQWVDRYQFHYKMDAHQLVDVWEPI
ncbi:MAG TPA: hypothetical protein P5519_02325 [Spirochaetia bacterium]|nr:hypothetical protein [Spirochaetales bacterium]HPD80531.1 hypothetical protein [Spirochaetales bacterium]HQK34274.1 hypothetical protein [Spirochaetales bacterium]HRS64712.1 hypothetical protein [Spirochaetia bacterium]HRV27612.1 hypothetical protein [Spirochaetia bacterium]